MDRLPPFSLEAEQAALGCMLLDAQLAVTELVSELGADGVVFYDLRNRTIWQAICALTNRSQPVDTLTVMQELKVMGQLDAVGGAAYLAMCQDQTPSASNIPYYVEILKEKLITRRMIAVCTNSVSDAYAGSIPFGELLDRLERDVLALRPGRPKGMKTAKELVNEAVATMEKVYAHEGAITGLPTGFSDLDAMIDGLHPGEMTVLSGFPGNGKTSMAMNIAEHVLLNEHRSVGFFSLEMTALALVMRCICSHSRVNLRNIKKGFLDERDFSRIITSASKIANAAIWIDDASDLSIYELRSRARRMKQQHKIDLLMIDYLQRLKATGGQRKIESRQQELSDISNETKAMAGELNIPVVILSQLNDDGKLLGSRTPGQDGDNVFRLEKQNGDKADDGGPTPMVLRIMKQRNGPVGSVNLVFLRDITRFECASKSQDDGLDGILHRD